MKLTGSVALSLLLVSIPCSEPVTRSAAGFTFGSFHGTEEIAATFEELAELHPRWFQAGDLGRSFQGRPIPLLTITDFEAPGPKLGLWIDGAIHGGELGSAEPGLAFVEAVRERVSAAAQPAWLSDVVIYVVPVINVDARYLSLRPPYPNVRRNLRPVDDDGDGLFDEDGPADLNGDGRIARMPVGGDSPFEARDADGDGRCGEDPPGGVDLNRNFPVRRASRATDWRPEPEVAAIVEFLEQHPEIAVAFNYHTSYSVLIWPADAAESSRSSGYSDLSDLYRKHVGERVWDSGKQIGELIGTCMEWFHEQGAIAFTVEVGPVSGSPASPSPLPTDWVDHPCHGLVQMPRIESGYSSAFETRLEQELQAATDRHAAFLLDVAEWLGSRDRVDSGR
ncbi:MAG TPA: M14 family zinc carboxypeptidase [Planctomycetota bacterium]|nr:M14 family zinc carboxypeptidase [Planctomycetota bacterium]